MPFVMSTTVLCGCGSEAVVAFGALVEDCVEDFPVQMPSGVRYWTVVDQNLVVVPAADRFLREERFGRDRAELTTKAHAGAIVLFLRWCARTGRDQTEIAGTSQPGVSRRSRCPPADPPHPA
jgi:hypothetical protein